MAEAYSYARALHKRRPDPGPFSTYQKYKPFLKADFRRTCVYCRTPDDSKGNDAFGVDHYLPKEYFKALKTSYTNLFYCCNTCNRRKGKYFPDDLDKREKRFVPNPCDHRMFEHLQFVGLEVKPKTVAGRHTVELLKLNDKEWLRHRRMTQAAIEHLQSEHAVAEAWLRELVARRSAATGSKAATLLVEEAEARSAVDELEELLRGLGSLP
ncbi:MAG: hypothetical protein HOQ30_12960 [Gemmatimonadaceae bacterium]|nr:hypothetical protein [Gemmatimonadaceae bacterium]NUQ92572.1 hypothetical protein [Gemmatimonadaceae bacterium]NUR34915.1 hypothetical protein [Gemmatimonadaceae bacterium]